LTIKKTYNRLVTKSGHFGLGKLRPAMLGSSADGVTGTNTVMGNVDIISSDPGKLISA
jgi:hypothetical protein